MFTLNIKTILAVVAIIAGVVYKKYSNNLFLFTNTKPIDKVILSQEELGQYNGIVNQKLYLAVLGQVFDVTDGDKHYKQGSSYNYFIGKDGSRALITGNFEDESTLKDHVIDLSCSNLFALLNWRQTYRKKYKYVGLLEGRFYNAQGEETEYLKQLKYRLKECQQEKLNNDKETQKYPPCNMIWNKDGTSRVWCTIASGGVTRNWVGVPRQLYTPGKKDPHCVCVQIDNEDNTKQFKLYENCPPSSVSCPPN